MLSLAPTGSAQRSQGLGLQLGAQLARRLFTLIRVGAAAEGAEDAALVAERLHVQRVEPRRLFEEVQRLRIRFLKLLKIF